MDAPSLILLTGFIGVLAAVSFAWPISSFQPRHVTALVLGLLAVLVIFNSTTPYGIHRIMIKGITMIPNPCPGKMETPFLAFMVYQLENRQRPAGDREIGVPDRPVLQYRTDIDGGPAHGSPV